MTQPAHILVTGASSGLGQAIAQKLLARGDQVTATARRQERLLELDGANAKPLDLLDAEAVTEFCGSFCEDLDANRLDGLILNAGMTMAGPFLESDLETDLKLINLNITANLRLLRGLLPALEASQGRVLLVASLGGLTPLPYQAVYGGTKAFLVNFGLALREELEPRGVRLTIFAPGGIATEMTDIPAMSHLRKELAPADAVADAAIRAYDSGEALSVPGLKNRAIAAAAKLLPRGFVARQSAKIYRPQ